MAPELIALDWGTSSLRAFLMAAGQVLEQRQSAHGIQHLPQPGREGFEQAFKAIAGDWVQQWPHLPVLACGMVGSAQGWREAPYVRCPVDMRTLAESHVSIESGLGPSVTITPGVLYDQAGELPDVMRGEETQIAGALLVNHQWADRSCIVLPGTHSKWAHVEGGRITRYSTYMTGEMFDVMRRYSILGRLMPQGDVTDVNLDSNAGAFALGVSTAQQSRPGALLHELFATRTLGLTGRFPATSLTEYLSGLLIGQELIAGLTSAGDLSAIPLVMVGDPALCARYQMALKLLGSSTGQLLDNTAPSGLWLLAQTAGLVGKTRP